MWRQSRIFTSTQTANWYFQMIDDLVRPWRGQAGAATTQYFFTKYLCPLGMDDADTEIAQLPGDFRQQSQYGPIHRSIRLRYFEPPAPAGAAQPPAAAGNLPIPPLQQAFELLMQAHPNRYWRYDFRDYDIANDLGGDRFSAIPAAQIQARRARGEKVAAVLEANCDLVLELVRPGGFEQNGHELNFCLKTPVQSVAHLLNNVWCDETGNSPALWARNDGRGIRMKV